MACILTSIHEKYVENLNKVWQSALIILIVGLKSLNCITIALLHNGWYWLLIKYSPIKELTLTKVIKNQKHATVAQ